uniref:B3 domain-containing protein REM10-like isoform X2 n=1 Tax=Erigeron canadensis TaxID=72917 RepID=UPI001CB9837B|nr:B3 domain-containing protein REM10-like isoform X2 [Erigeron canadensis]
MYGEMKSIAMRAPADHFFKFIPVSHHNNSRLQSIPKSFRKYLKAGRKNKIAILKRRNQRWAVKIVDDWVFGEGWDKFTKDNGVKDFDIVVFRHEGDMVFDTMVFDSSWCEREYSTDLVTKSSRTSLKKIHRANNVYYSKKSLLKAKKITKPDQSHHPYFVGTLKQYGRNLNKWLYVPKIFALENGLSNGEMILKDVEYEGSWTVNLRSHSGRNFCIQRGLSEFCTAIGLEAGDSFRFELIQKEEKPVAIVSRLPKVALSNPYFRSTVTAYSIKRTSLNIPLSFARSNRLDKKNCEMVVMDGKQRLWPTKLCRPGDHVCIRELRDMLVANGLKEGDEILLELIKNEDNPLMKLHDLSEVSPNGKRVQSIFQAIPSRQRVPNPPPNLCFKSTATAHSIEYYHVYANKGFEKTQSDCCM